jgi:hypothetical protein
VFEFTKKHVLEALPPVLRRVAFNGDYTQEACALLWRLGRSDPRELNQYPDHGVRILADLASYEPGKPVWFTQKVLDAAQTWLADPDLGSYKYSPLDVVTRMLAKQGEYHKLEGHSISFGFVGINLPAVESLRKQAVACVEKCLAHPHPRVAVRALQVVREIVNHPASMVGRMVTDEEMAAWRPEQLEGVRLLKQFLARTKNPVLQAYAIHELGWHAENGHPAEVAKEVSAALAGIPPSLQLDLAVALTNALYDIGRGKPDFTERQERFVRDLAERFLKEKPGAEGIAEIEAVLKKMEEAECPHSGSQFVWELARRDREQGRLMLEHILSHDRCLMGGYTPALLIVLRLANVKASIGFAERLLAKDRPDLTRFVAASYVNSDFLRHPREEDFVLLRRLLNGDDNAKYYALESLRKLKDAEPAEQAQRFQRQGIELLLGTDIGQNPRMAEAFAEAIDLNFGIAPKQLTETDVEKILEKMVPVRELTNQNFHLNRLMVYLVGRSPRLVVKYFADRILYSILHREDQRDYTPTPFLWEGLFGGIADTPLHAELLRELAEHLKEKDALTRYWFTKLFGLVAGSFGASTTYVISELAKDNSEDTYKVIGHLLDEAPREFVFLQRDLCANLVEQADRISPDAHRRILAALLGSSQSGGFQGISGEPSPQQIAIRDQARQLATEYAGRPVVEKFYRQVADLSQELLDKQLASDEEDFVE